MSSRHPRLAVVLLTPAALAAGAALGLWAYKRWGYAVEAEERDVPIVDAPPEAAGPAIQHADEGAGPRFHRRYRVRVHAPTLTPEALMTQIGADITAFVAPEVARFEKTKGASGELGPGDEFLVHIRAPWNGPVRVVEVEPAMFRLATLETHMEAGQIEFRAEEAAGGDLVFTIESWARSRDATVDVAYDDLGAAKAAQQAMWTFFCEKVAEAAGGEKVGEIEVMTEREAT